MFAVLVIEREPLTWAQLPGMVQLWIEGTGVYAMAGLVLVVLFRALRPANAPLCSAPIWKATLFLGSVSLLLLAAAGVLYAADSTSENRSWVFRSGCIGAITAVLLPILENLFSLRWRRIWALAIISFKEAIRRKVLWVFSALALVFLFASWYLPYTPQYQLRSYVNTVYRAMTPLLIVVAGLLAAFSIPADLRHQTMHTIVTKPVERFEIVLGRCLGYILLMTLVQFVITAFSLVYVARGVDPAAAEESYKARVPVFGELTVERAKSVGREWGYRKYITAETGNRAFWVFHELPDFSKRNSVRCEFEFDIFRTTKGVQGRGIYCTFVFETPRWNSKRLNDYNIDREWLSANLSAREADVRAQSERERWFPETLQRRLRLIQTIQAFRAQTEKRETSDRDQLALANALADEYGRYELRSKEVRDYHTLFIDAPGRLFAKKGDETSDRPPLFVIVRCESPTQYLGVAEHDLYLLADERSFEVNFFKGAIGLWLRICLVITVAIALSTYLTGVISFLVTMMLYLAGLTANFIQSVAEGTIQGGGPLESALRLAKQVNPLVPLDQTPTTRLFLGVDEVFRFVMRLFLNVIPDVERHDLTNYVANGFDIPVGQLVVDNVMPLVGYLIGWMVVGFYLLKSREIAA
ncbi:MAG: hypothetical protein KatS3mg105_3699 [Gemmatales bacterium]|nr:MAG: hypothetical protein KatS3mg105_3699 [Gemmatales bacterium]